jgi:hypothetical protein
MKSGTISQQILPFIEQRGHCFHRAMRPDSFWQVSGSTYGHWNFVIAGTPAESTSGKDYILF